VGPVYGPARGPFWDVLPDHLDPVNDRNYRRMIPAQVSDIWVISSTRPKLPMFPFIVGSNQGLR
jgi:hypothetical protein